MTQGDIVWRRSFTGCQVLKGILSDLEGCVLPEPSVALNSCNGGVLRLWRDEQEGVSDDCQRTVEGFNPATIKTLTAHRSLKVSRL